MFFKTRKDYRYVIHVAGHIFVVEYKVLMEYIGRQKVTISIEKAARGMLPKWQMDSPNRTLMVAHYCSEFYSGSEPLPGNLLTIFNPLSPAQMNHVLSEISRRDRIKVRHEECSRIRNEESAQIRAEMRDRARMGLFPTY